MPIPFDEIRPEERKLLEFTLFEGVNFNLVASSVPTAYASDKISDMPGVMFPGYVVERDGNQLRIAFCRPSSRYENRLGGVNVYVDAIHSIEEKVDKKDLLIG